MTKLATRDQILGLQDIGYQDIDMSNIPGWEGITIRVKDLTAGERDKLEAGMVEEKKVQQGRKVKTERSTNMENVRARFCAACIVDEQLQPIFLPEDIKALGRKSAAALDRIFTVIQERNGLNQNDLEEMAENFTSDPDGDSPTG